MFSYKGLNLTISEADLTVSEKREVDCLMRLGDSLELALWTVEHQERKRPDNCEAYMRAYHN